MALEDIWRDMDAVVDEENAEEEVCPTPPPVSSASLISHSLYEKFSIFGDSDCGEPTKSQHLVIDFSPDDILDDDESQERVCNFWNLINSQPEIQHLCVKPDPNLGVEYTASATDHSPAPSEPSAVEEPVEKTALSTISLYEKRGILKPSFLPKMCVSKCSFGQQEYVPIDPCISKPLPRLRPCTCKGVCNMVCSRVKQKDLSKAKSKARTRAMCDELDRWDEQHPKSMEPPGALLHRRPQLQRKPPQP